MGYISQPGGKVSIDFSRQVAMSNLKVHPHGKQKGVLLISAAKSKAMKVRGK